MCDTFYEPKRSCFSIDQKEYSMGKEKRPILMNRVAGAPVGKYNIPSYFIKMKEVHRSTTPIRRDIQKHIGGSSYKECAPKKTNEPGPGSYDGKLNFLSTKQAEPGYTMQHRTISSQQQQKNKNDK